MSMARRFDLGDTIEHRGRAGMVTAFVVGLEWLWVTWEDAGTPPSAIDPAVGMDLVYTGHDDQVDYVIYAPGTTRHGKRRSECGLLLKPKGVESRG